jgi:DNA replication and repair protein RecF
VVHLDWLSISGFRCYEGLRFEPDDGVNILVGPNGSGKTSALEAIGYLVTLASFRRSPDAALVAIDASAAVVRGAFVAARRDTTVEVEIPAQGRRRVLVNGKRVQSRSEIAEGVSLVAFLPDDLDLVKRGPALRREFLDDAAAQLWPAAATEQREFDRALRQRNALLRGEGRRADPVTLDVWDDRVSRLGATVMERRLAVGDALGEEVSAVHGELSAGGDHVSWTYVSSALGPIADRIEVDLLARGLLDALTASRRADMERRTTTIGPHRDELMIEIGKRDARTRASQGEQRSIALAMRVALHRGLAGRRDEPPILLLDDVFSELDPQRSRRLVDLLPRGQVFVTSARAEEVPMVGRRWAVTAGSVVAS